MDKRRIMAFAERINRDMAGAMSAGMAYLGLKAGLFDAMKGKGAMSAGELAEAAQCDLRYVEEWLAGMVAAEWLEHEVDADGTLRFRLPDEHAWLVASQGSDHFMGGLALSVPSLLSQAPAVAQAFHDGGGVAFSEFDAGWAEAVDAMNAGTYQTRLTGYWLTHVPEVVERLAAGGRALDVGCGLGAVSMALARAFPAAHVTGVDIDPASIARAGAQADAAGLTHIDFVAGALADMAPDQPYDLATLFDCLHDLSDPLGVLHDIRVRLGADGTLLIMEPRAADDLAGNIHPVGAMFYGFSLFHCMTQSLAAGGPGHGTCMGPARSMALLQEAGFSRVEQLDIKSPTNLFYAARI